MSVCTSAASFPEGEDAIGSDGVVEVRMTVDESGDVSMLSGEVQKWFTLHAELPVETLMDPALLIANTHILFNPKRGDIKVSLLSRQRLSPSAAASWNASVMMPQQCCVLIDFDKHACVHWTSNGFDPNPKIGCCHGTAAEHVHIDRLRVQTIPYVPKGCS